MPNLDNAIDANADSSPAPDVNVDSSTTDATDSSPAVQQVPYSRLQQVISRNKQQEQTNAREMDALRSELSTFKDKQANQAATLESFGYDEDAFNDHKRSEKQSLELDKIRDELKAEVRTEFAQQQQQATFNSNLNNYNQKASEYISKNPDYTKAEENMNIQSMQFSPAVADVILRTNNPAVQHALMNDLQKLHSLNQLTDPTDIALAIGGIQLNLQKSVSSAPDPSPSVGNGSTSVNKKPEDMNMAEFAQMRRNGT